MVNFGWVRTGSVFCQQTAVTLSLLVDQPSYRDKSSSALRMDEIGLLLSFRVLKGVGVMEGSWDEGGGGGRTVVTPVYLQYSGMGRGLESGLSSQYPRV